MPNRLLAARLHEAHIVHHEPVVLRGGATSDFYVDIKKAYGQPRLLRGMARAILEEMDVHIQPTCIAAAGYGCIPLATVMSQQSNLPLSMVRDSPKNHGRPVVIDGYVPSVGDAAFIVDDVFTSGDSLGTTIAAVDATGAAVVGCHVVVARGDVTNFAVPLSFLFRPEDIVALPSTI